MIADGLKSISAENPLFDESEKFKNVNVYPNPASTKLYVEHPVDASIKIFDMRGQLLYKKASIGSTTVINLEDLNRRGLLLIKVLSENNVSNFKVIVN